MIGNDTGANRTKSASDSDASTTDQPADADPDASENADESAASAPESPPEPSTPDNDGQPAAPEEQSNGNSQAESADSAAPANDSEQDDSSDDSNNDTSDGPSGFDVTVETDLVDSLIGIPNAIVEEARLDVTPESVSVTAVDPANVAFASATLDADAFSSYSVGSFEIGLGFERASDVLGFFPKDSTINLAIDDVGKLTYSGEGMEFTQGLITPESIRNVDGVPEFDETTLTVKSDFFSQAVKAADMVSDHLEIRIEDQTLCISADGDTDSIEATASDDDIVSPPDSDGAHGMYDIGYMNEVNRAIEGDTVTIGLGEDMPVSFRGDFADGDGTYELMVAPRIQPD